MIAIIIEEERFTEIRTIMESSCDKLAKHYPEKEGIIREAYRMMNYDFVKWAQSHGASCVK